MFRIVLSVVAILSSFLSKSQDKTLKVTPSSSRSGVKIIIVERMLKTPSFYMEKGNKLYELSNLLEDGNQGITLENTHLGISITAPSHIRFTDPYKSLKRVQSWLEREFLHMGVAVAFTKIKIIYFDVNSALIRNNACVELDKLANLMYYNPSISAKLIARTDIKGSSADNKKLATKRGESVVYYLGKSDIEVSRLTVQTAEANIVANMIKGRVLPSDEIDQLNRRVEFVLNMGDANLP